MLSSAASRNSNSRFRRPSWPDTTLWPMDRVEFAAAPGRVTKGLARHAVPVMLLARLAVDRRFAGKGLGTELLRDALLRTLSAADIAGLRAVVVDAKDEAAKGFYEKFGFEAFPGNSFRLSLILKDVRALVRS